jgi:hypothetical protein
LKNEKETVRFRRGFIGGAYRHCSHGVRVFSARRSSDSIISAFSR